MYPMLCTSWLPTGRPDSPAQSARAAESANVFAQAGFLSEGARPQKRQSALTRRRPVGRPAPPSPCLPRPPWPPKPPSPDSLGALWSAFSEIAKKEGDPPGGVRGGQGGPGGARGSDHGNRGLTKGRPYGLGHHVPPLKAGRHAPHNTRVAVDHRAGALCAGDAPPRSRGAHPVGREARPLAPASAGRQGRNP